MLGTSEVQRLKCRDSYSSHSCIINQIVCKRKISTPLFAWDMLPWASQRSDVEISPSGSGGLGLLQLGKLTIRAVSKLQRMLMKMQQNRGDDFQTIDSDQFQAE